MRAIKGIYVFVMLLICLCFNGFGQRNDSFPPQYRVSLKEAHIGDLKTDTLLLNSFHSVPENIRQFYFITRGIFSGNPDADFSHPEIIKAARQQGLFLMGGPMLGNLQDNGISLWMRPAFKGDIEIKVINPEGTVAKSYSLESVIPGVEQRFWLSGLEPGTCYKYAVYTDEQKISESFFCTAPAEEEQGTFRLAFGADFHKIGLHNPVLLNGIMKRKPFAMMLLGDNAVDDRENRINMHRSDYQLRDLSEPWKKFVAQIPVYATWDDHDYFNNDLSGIPEGFDSVDREAVRSIWHENWNNPVPKAEREGIFFNTRIGPVEMIMLDTRSCRDIKRRHKYNSYLGQAQLKWLKQTLQNSTAPFKIISSGTMWTDHISEAKDSWGSWDLQTREEIFMLIEKEKIGGVLFISGDRHGARGFKIERSSGFTMYEFEVGTLGGVPGPAAAANDCPEQLFGYSGKNFIAFGEFVFETDLSDPMVTFRLITESGEILEEYSYSLSQLTPSN